jgi:hypothetical protein
MLLGVLPGEKSISAPAFLYALLIGLAQGWLKTIPISLFLTRFEVSAIPIAYLGIAGSLIVFGILYEVVSKHVSPAILFSFFIALSCFLILFFWIMLLLSQSSWIYWGLLISALTVFDLMDLTLWGTLNRLFTLDQGKRMFGAMGMFQTVSGIIGNLLIPVFLVFLPTSQLIVMISVVLFASMFCLQLICKRFPQRFTPASIEATPSSNQEKVVWFKNRYFVNTMLFSALSLFTLAIVEIAFYGISKMQIHEEKQLASFLALFFAVLNGFQIVCQGVIAPFLIKKYGVGITLSVRPIFTCIIGIAAIVLLLLGAPFFTLFSLFVLMKLFDEALNNSSMRQGILALYQALSPHLRIQLQAMVEFFVIPISTVTACLLFVALQYYFSFDITILSAFVTIPALATILIIFPLQKGYIENLKNAIQHRFIVFSKEILGGKCSQMLLEKVEHGTPKEAMYCLGLLSQADLGSYKKGLNLSLASTNPMIRNAAEMQLRMEQKKEIVDTDLKSLLEKQDWLNLKHAISSASNLQKEELFSLCVNAVHKKSDKTILGQLYLCIGSLNTPASSTWLLNTLYEMKETYLQKKLLEALDINQATLTSPEDLGKLNLLLARYVHECNQLFEFYKDTKLDLLTNIIAQQIRSIHEQIFSLLSLVYPKEMIHNIMFFYQSRDVDKASYAQELLWNLLEGEHKKLLFTAFKPVEVGTSSVDELTLLKKIVETSPTPFLKAVALQLIGKMGLKELKEDVRQALADENGMVAETAKQTLGKMDVDI